LGRAERRDRWPGPAGIGSRLEAVIQYIDRRLDAAVERMIALCRVCSLATERADAAERRLCAEWFVEELRCIGFSASIRDMPGAPIAVAHDRGSQGPEVLFCGHYNARPVDLSREEAASSVLAAAARARSADQPTQVMAFVEACRAWRAVAGQLPTPVSVLIAGEGRSGSVRLRSFLRTYADELKADIGLAPALRISCCAVPTINFMLRGLCSEAFIIVAAQHGQSAGSIGGVAASPTQILARILGDLHDPSGRVTIPGFYADVATLRAPGDKPGASLLAAKPVFPTCEIESIGSNHNSGRPRAFAKLSFHLVCDQDPDAIRRTFRDFACSRVPPGSQIEFTSGTLARSVRFAVSRPAFRKAQDALTAEWGRQAAFACGDAAPAVHALRDALGMEVIVTSFPEQPEGCRGPREMPELARYRGGIHSWARILDALAQ
jgi:acetylornithine deacetylase/succinyl-diaminopimelate desuccinylase-like protein